MILSSASAMNLVKAKILLFGEELNRGLPNANFVAKIGRRVNTQKVITTNEGLGFFCEIEEQFVSDSFSSVLSGSYKLW